MLGRYVSRRHEGSAVNDEEKRWDVILEQYGWGELDELDVSLINFVETNILDVDDIEKKARSVEAARQRITQMGAFEQSWRLFHDSFGDNEDEVCEKVVDGVRNNFAVVSRANLDAAVSILEELGRTADADALIDFAKDHGENSFWVTDDPFYRRIDDPRIRHLAEERKDAAKPVFDFEKDLLSAATYSVNTEKFAQLASVPVERYQSLFESASADDLNRYVYAALEYRKILNASEDQRKIVSNAEEALRRIGRKSKLNEIRVRKYGVSLEEFNKGDGESD
jgi:hypothetical protein